MAKIEIESAFVEPWTRNQDEHPSWGMKTAEPHSRKNDDGKYETVGRTFRTVKVSRNSGIDLTEFRKGDRVQVWGNETTETREHEGKKFYDLVVWADRVERIDSQHGAGATHSAPNTDSGAWAGSNDSDASTGGWPVAEVPENLWPAEDPGVPF